MKLLNFCFVCLIICLAFEKSHGTDLDCQFKNEIFHLGTFYSCQVPILDNSNNNTVITGYLNKNNTNVEGIWIHDTNTKFIPTNLGLLFDIIALWMDKTQLVEIKSQDFHSMQNLIEINLPENSLTFLPIDVFSALTKLKYVNLNLNQIEEIPNGVFSNNLNLESFYLWQNKIKFLGTTVFDGLPMLNIVDLLSNICNDKFYRGKAQIIELIYDIKMRCNVPNEEILFEIKKLGSSSFCSKEEEPKNRIEVQLEKQEHKMDELLKVFNEKQQNEFEQLEIKLLEAGEQHRKNTFDMEKINDKNSKLEQQVNELNNKLSNALKTAQNVQENHQKQMNETHDKLQQENAKLINDISTSNDLQKSQQMIMMQSMGEVLKLNELRRLDQLAIENLKKEFSDVKLDQQKEHDEVTKLELENTELNNILATVLDAKRTQQVELSKLNLQRREELLEMDRVKEELKKSQSQVSTLIEEKNQCNTGTTILDY